MAHGLFKVLAVNGHAVEVMIVGLEVFRLPAALDRPKLFLDKIDLEGPGEEHGDLILQFEIGFFGANDIEGLDDFAFGASMRLAVNR
jgi:hypothetical protein